MKKFFFTMCVASLLLGNKNVDFSIYANLLNALKPAEVAQFVATLAPQYLPAKINDNITLKSISAQESSLNGIFSIDKDVKNLKADLISGAKRDLCINGLFVKILERDLVLNGLFFKDGNEKFRISVDRQFCAR